MGTGLFAVIYTNRLRLNGQCIVIIYPLNVVFSIYPQKLQHTTILSKLRVIIYITIYKNVALNFTGEEFNIFDNHTILVPIRVIQDIGVDTRKGREKMALPLIIKQKISYTIVKYLPRA